MPVNEHAWPVIARVPFGQEVLVERTEFFGIGGTGSCGLAPDVRQSRLEGGIGHFANGGSQVLWRHEPLLGVDQLPVTDSMVTSTDALETNITVMWNIPIRCIN